MPNTEHQYSELPKGIYDAYIPNIKQLLKTNSCIYITLNDDDNFVEYRIAPFSDWGNIKKDCIDAVKYAVQSEVGKKNKPITISLDYEHLPQKQKEPELILPSDYAPIFPKKERKEITAKETEPKYTAKKPEKQKGWGLSENKRKQITALYEQGFNPTEIIRITNAQSNPNKVRSFIALHLRGIAKCELTPEMIAEIDLQYKKSFGSKTISDMLGLNYELVYEYICKLLNVRELSNKDRLTDIEQQRIEKALNNNCSPAYLAQKLGVDLALIVGLERKLK